MATSKRQARVLLGALLSAVALLMFAQGAWGQPSQQSAEPSSGRVTDKDPRSGAPYASGELIVTFKSGASEAAREAVARQRGGYVRDKISAIRAKTFSFPAVKNRQGREVRERALAQVKQALEQNPLIEAVDYNYQVKASYSFNDYRFPAQYGLRVPGFPQAWDRTHGWPGVRIAIVDTGIASSHPDIRGKVVAQRDFVNNDAYAQDDDPGGHGTHAAGIAGAATGNRNGISAACPSCTLVAAKVLDRDGYGYYDDIAKGIVWSVNNGARVVNLSLGGPSSSTALQNAVNYAYNRNALVVVAAGNESTSKPSYPAAYTNAMAVAATDSYDKRAYYSNYGSWVDVAAPGSSIVSTVPAGYSYKSGTSMASPHVAGLAGLLVAQGYRNYEVRYRIERTATDLGATGRDAYYGYGRMNAAAAVR